MAAATPGNGFKAGQLIATKNASVGGASGGAKTYSTGTYIQTGSTGMADGTATAVATVTVPNAQHSAAIDVDVLGIMGAGGAIGAGEANRLSKYQITVIRTVGLATVVNVGAVIGGVASNVAGAGSIATVVVTASAVTGANTTTQTFQILVAVTKTAGSSNNHSCVAAIAVINQQAGGVTIAQA